MRPGAPTVARAPDTASGPGSGHGGVYGTGIVGMENYRVAAVLERGNRVVPAPGGPTVAGDEHPVTARKRVGDATQSDMVRVEGVDGDGAYAHRYLGSVRRREDLPVVSAVHRAKYPYPGVRVDGEVGLACSAVDDVRVGWVQGQGPDVQCRLIVPQWGPVPAAIGASPDAASGRSGEQSISIAWVADEGGHAPAHVGRPHELPLGIARLARQPGRNGGALPDQRRRGGLAHRPGRAGSEPVSSDLVCRKLRLRRPGWALLSRAGSQRLKNSRV